VVDDFFSIRNICKSFAGIQVLSNVSFSVKEGEVRALVGENGAGKSTLMKILSGVHLPDRGEMKLKGKDIPFGHLLSIQELGVSVIYQEFSLVEELSIAENLFLRQASEKKPLQFVPWDEYNKKTTQILEDMGICGIDPHEKVSQLSVAHKQMVEIAKALTIDAKLIVMDEPSATLNQEETDHLLKIVDELKRKGVSIIYITHRLEELPRIADTVTILKDGQVVETRAIDTIDKAQIISLMVGRDVTDYFPSRGKKHFDKDNPVLSVRNLVSNCGINNSSFELYRGEILGIGGLTGSGRTELVRALCGLDGGKSEETLLEGKQVKITKIKDAIRKGIAYLPEERKTEGLVLSMSIKANTSFTSIKNFLKMGLISRTREERAVWDMIKRLRIKCEGPGQLAYNLSGGNQQKVVIAKWLLNQPLIYIMDEPTRGIDVGAKKEIYEIMKQITQEGASIIFISSEMPELLNMSDRILVMAHGTLAGELDIDEASEEKILTMAVHDKDYSCVEEGGGFYDKNVR